MKVEKKPYDLKIPVILISGKISHAIQCEEEGPLGVNLFVYGDSIEKAEQNFLECYKDIIETYKRDSDLLKLLIPFKYYAFRDRDTNKLLSLSMTSYGLNVYIRIGKGMIGGWYIPFTQINLTFNNYWNKIKRKKKKK